MTAITAFETGFEGTVGQLVPTPVGGGQNPATGRTKPVYSATSQVGNTSADWNITVAENTTITFASTPTTYGLVYLDFYLDLYTLPSANTAILNWQNSTTGLIGAIRIYNPNSPAGTFNLQIRGGASGFVDIWNSVTDAAPDWNLTPGVYRIQLQIRPENANGYSLKVFSGAGIDSDTPTHDSGVISSIGSSSAAIDEIRIGTVSTVTAGFRIDDIKADDTNPISRASTATGGHFVKVGGAWEEIVSQQYKSGGAWS